MFRAYCQSFCRHFAILLFFLMSFSAALAQQMRLSAGDLVFSLNLTSGQYGFSEKERAIVAADRVSGVLLEGKPVSFKPAHCGSTAECTLQGANGAGDRMSLTVKLSANQAEIIAQTEKWGEEIRFQTAGASPAYGLADHAVYKASTRGGVEESFNADVTGFQDDQFLSGQGIARLVSNFVIYPKQGFAELLIDPSTKIVHTSAEQIVQGVKHTHQTMHLFYFFGDPHTIYASYQKARKDAGYRVWMPKYQAFGVGWEAFGALGWTTDEKTVKESVDRYLREGYPLRWAVIGSGFWPASPDTMHETTSFGLWDKTKYPDPRALIAHFNEEHLAVMLGLRITFIVGGPYSEEGVKRGFFLKKDGVAQIFQGGWPKLPYYLLDAENPAALNWYMDLVAKWQAYGVEGWKEDFYGYGDHDYALRDDKVDPTNDRLMAQKQLVIERNGYLSSNGDLHRIDDFNYNQNQDRGPVNTLALAYSGFPYIYSDIVGGTFNEARFDIKRTPQMETYMMRNVQWQSLHSSMGMGEPPWSFSPKVAQVMLQAAQFHARIAPYLYSNARRSYADGFPWTMVPLPIAFPEDAAVYGRENSKDRAYEWMIGDSVLATPLYGDDYFTSNTRDVYLPKGRWMDFDSGEIYAGGQMLKGYALPPSKTPLFIGGPGATVEEIEGKVRVCIYPVSEKATATLTVPESEQQIQVDVRGLTAGRPWHAIRVTETAGPVVPSRSEGRGFSFIPLPGRHYIVQALP